MSHEALNYDEDYALSLLPKNTLNWIFSSHMIFSKEKVDSRNY